jgi:hypothetical protein
MFTNLPSADPRDAQVRAAFPEERRFCDSGHRRTGPPAYNFPPVYFSLIPEF